MGWHCFELIFENLNVGRRLLANADAVDPGTVGTEWATELDNLCPAVAGIANPDQTADFERFSQVLSCHHQSFLYAGHHGAGPRMRSK